MLYAKHQQSFGSSRGLGRWLTTRRRTIKKRRFSSSAINFAIITYLQTSRTYQLGLRYCVGNTTTHFAARNFFARFQTEILMQRRFSRHSSSCGLAGEQKRAPCCYASPRGGAGAQDGLRRPQRCRGRGGGTAAFARRCAQQRRPRRRWPSCGQESA